MQQQIDRLVIRFPAHAGYLTVSRLNAAAVGSAAGLDVEQLDDLRLAVNEAVTWLLADEQAGGEVELVLSAHEGRIIIDGVRTGEELAPRKPDDLIEAILGATVDRFSLIDDVADQRRIHLEKGQDLDDARR